MNIYGIIYKITNKINNKVYIGQTTTKLNKRYSGGIYNTHNKHLRNSINKYGIENFEIDEEYALAYSEDELNILEIEIIKKYNATNPEFGYNKKDGGSNGKPTKEVIEKLKVSHTGYIMPIKQKEKISKALKGEKSYMYGISKSDDIRNKISNSLKGKYVGINSFNYGRRMPRESVEKMIKSKTGMKYSDTARINMSKCRIGVKLSNTHKENISKARKGIVFTEEHRGNISKAKKGVSMPEEQKRKISNTLKGRERSKNAIDKTREKLQKRVMCITTGEVFESLGEASERFNVHKASICNCCNGKQKKSGKLPDGTKLEWKYV